MIGWAIAITIAIYASISYFRGNQYKVQVFVYLLIGLNVKDALNGQFNQQSILATIISAMILLFIVIFMKRKLPA